MSLLAFAYANRTLGTVGVTPANEDDFSATQFERPEEGGSGV